MARPGLVCRDRGLSIHPKPKTLDRGPLSASTRHVDRVEQTPPQEPRIASAATPPAARCAGGKKGLGIRRLALQSPKP